MNVNLLLENRVLEILIIISRLVILLGDMLKLYNYSWNNKIIVLSRKGNVRKNNLHENFSIIKETKNILAQKTLNNTFFIIFLVFR